MTATTDPTPVAGAQPPRRRRRWPWVLVALGLLLGFVLLLGFGAWRYTKVYLYDDYARGFTLGKYWASQHEERSCREAVELFYPPTPSNPAPRGSAAFRIGCFDGMTGHAHSGWNMRNAMDRASD